MRKITKKEAGSMGFLSQSKAKELENALAKCELGEGVLVLKKEWGMKSHPMSVIRHIAKHRKKSGIYKFTFQGKTEKGTSVNWESYIIVRV